MKNNVLIKIGTGVLALAMVFTLAACGSSDNDTEEAEDTEEIEVSEPNVKETEEIEETEYENSPLIGTWRSESDDNGSYYETVVTDDGQMTVYYIVNDILPDDIADDDAGYVNTDNEIFWVGTYSEIDDNAVVSGFTSRRDDDADMTYTGDKLRFTYQADTDELNFAYDDESGNEVQVNMLRFTKDAEKSAYDNFDDDTVETTEDSVYFDDNNIIVDTDDNVNLDITESDTAFLDTDNVDGATNMQDNNNDAGSSSADTQSSVSDADVADNVSANTKVSNATVSGGSSTCVHNYGSGVTTKEPTCTQTGTRTYTCSKCGAVRTETLSALGHNYIDTVTKAATCGANGVRTHACSRCGDSYTTTIAATGNHDWQNVTEQVYVAEQGHYESGYVCNVCGYFAANSDAIATHIYLEHNNQAWYSPSDLVPGSSPYVIDTPAHYETVVTGQKCLVCGATK